MDRLVIVIRELLELAGRHSYKYRLAQVRPASRPGQVTEKDASKQILSRPGFLQRSVEWLLRYLVIRAVLFFARTNVGSQYVTAIAWKFSFAPNLCTSISRQEAHVIEKHIIVKTIPPRHMCTTLVHGHGCIRALFT